MEWVSVETQEDIQYLRQEYYSFHDACIHSLNYISGATVDNESSMHFEREENNLIVRFQSQMAAFSNDVQKKTLELKFIGLRKLILAGIQDNYFCDISDCYLDFYKGFVIWSDNDYFEPEKYTNSDLLKEPADTIIISEALQWRFI